MEILAFLLRHLCQRAFIINRIHRPIGSVACGRSVGSFLGNLGLANSAGALGATVAMSPGQDRMDAPVWIQLAFHVSWPHRKSLLSGSREGTFPQGSFYSALLTPFAYATAFLLMSKPPGENEHLKDIAESQHFLSVLARR